MRFHLDHIPKSSPVKIDHEQKIMLIGSCFSENIGSILSNSGFNVLSNPNGILFNPASISNSLKNIIFKKRVDASLIIQRQNGLYFSFANHGSIYAQTKQALESILQDTQDDAGKFLKETSHLIITFGSAFVYKHVQSNTVAANCHKLPAGDFEKRLLSVEEIVDDFKVLVNELKVFNSKIQISFTVSPVKYLREGVEENNLSKSTLLLAVNRICKELGCFYFPAYELVTDDLRDHRFYKEDLAHPNEEAIRYVWEKFAGCFFKEDTIQLVKEVESITTATNHTLLFPNTEEAKKFKENLEHKKRELKLKFPFLKF
jgi:hypothetical protein